MKGNPHAEAVNNGIQNVRELIGKREIYQREGLGLILEAQSRMAVAHEVRMLAMTNLLLASGAQYATDYYEDLMREIQQGMGRS